MPATTPPPHGPPAAPGRRPGGRGRGRGRAARPRAALVLLAAGSGSRVGADVNKVLLPLAGRSVLTWTLTWTAALPQLVDTVVVVRPPDEPAVREVVAREQPDRRLTVVHGGATRHASEYAAIRALARGIRAGRIDVVVIHDAARPLSGSQVFADVIEAAHLLGGALPVRSQPGLVALEPSLPPVGELVTVQTPQAFRAASLLAAYEQADRAGFDGTDTAVCVERFGDVQVRGLPGAASNIKITFPEDLFLAERILAANHWRMP